MRSNPEQRRCVSQSHASQMSTFDIGAPESVTVYSPHVSQTSSSSSSSQVCQAFSSALRGAFWAAARGKFGGLCDFLSAYWTKPLPVSCAKSASVPPRSRNSPTVVAALYFS